MILSCYNIREKRIRITIIEGWNRIFRYVSDFLFDNIDNGDFRNCSALAPSFYIDIVAVDMISNNIYNRMTLIMSASSVLESLEILKYHFLNSNNFEIVDAISMQCDYLSN